MGNSQVLFHVRGGRQARFAARRATSGPPAHGPERSCITPAGFLHVEEMEARIRYMGGHHVYWCLQVQTQYLGPLPLADDSTSVTSSSERSETVCKASQLESLLVAFCGGVNADSNQASKSPAKANQCKGTREGVPVLVERLRRSFHKSFWPEA